MDSGKLRVTVYYSEKMHKGKRYRVGSRRGNRYEFPVVPPSRVVQKGSILPPVMCDNICGVLSTRKTHEPWHQGFSWRSVTQTWSACVADLSYSDPVLPDFKLMPHGPMPLP